jgi:PAS domain S-box-containing protein
MASDDFKRIFETLRVAVVLTDAKGWIQYANSALAELASREERTLAGSGLVELFAEEDRKRVQAEPRARGRGQGELGVLRRHAAPRKAAPRAG